MEPDIPKRTNAFIELFPSTGLSSWIGNSAAASTRCWRGFLVGIKHRRELSRLADLDDHMLADIGLTRSDLYVAHCEPFWRDPAGVLHPEVGRDEVEAIRRAVWEALDGRCLLREELADEVVRRVGGRHEQRLRSGFAFFLGELCQGPPRGAKVTFVRPDQWIDGWHDVDADRALAEVCRRYLRTYGPARPSDFREWFSGRSFKPPQAQALFDALGGLEEVDVDGHRAFVLARDTAFPSREPSLRLLPEYDVYVMGFRERDRLVPKVVRDQIAAHGRGRYEGPAGVRLLLIDGIAAGLWERKKRGKRLELKVSPVRRLTRAQRKELNEEVARIGDFAGLEPSLVLE